jgi:translation elongation factor EF-G
MTQGRAVFTMQFSHYENAPNHVQEQIIEKYLGKKAAS